MVKVYDEDDYISYGDELRAAATRGTKQVGTSVKSLAAMFGRADAREISEELARDFKSIRDNEAKFQSDSMIEYNKVLEKKVEN